MKGSRTIRTALRALRRNPMRVALTILGIVIGIALSILGSLLWWRGKDTYSYFFILSAAFILFGLVLPNLLKPLQKAWMMLAVIIGWFMTRFILCILF